MICKGKDTEKEVEDNRFSDRNLKEYFKRCFFAVDGLWFVSTEENMGFEKALELDRQVWAILPKIQARKIRELLSLTGRTSEDLRTALEFKFKAEEYGYQAASADGELEFRLTDCPWLKLLRQSGREDLAPLIGKTICGIEYAVWAKEFGVRYHNNLEDRLCIDGKFCLLRFTG